MVESPWKTMHVASEEFSSREVVKTNQFCQCRFNNVKDIAYVFHARDVNSGKHSVIGKENVFTTRHQQAIKSRKRTNYKIVITIRKFHEFNSKNNARKRMWVGLDHVEENMRKVLWSATKINRATIKLCITREVWNYFKHKLNQSLISEDTKMLRNLSMHTCDFSMMPVKREQCVEKLSLKSVN